ncbi:MAG: bifunctional (p)ppGpp synthetase/guanosine-3',5'-bis(diphosphate) 3'-pyrophosphohydrolase [bacterium]|nr:bifunctional (p)ppGpp synthetase/guanosine-3',5'-bis(diphosphate) 3'-pyrophosphohydrolase [bacterium]
MKDERLHRGSGKQPTTVDDHRFETLLAGIAETNPGTDQDRIRQAYNFLQNGLEKGRQKLAGSPLEDPLEMAEILGQLLGDDTTIVAALLYPLVKTDLLDQSRLEKNFGPEVSFLMKGLTRTSGMKYRSRIEEQAENFRMMILAMAKDLRVVLLNLAKRLQVMRHIEDVDTVRQQEIAAETLEIYAPLANRLGVAQVKWEMEDLCLKVLHPAVYRELEERVPQNRKERRAYIAEVIKIVGRAMKAEGIPGNIVGRPKHFFSIYQKMVKRGVSFEDMFDLTALRIITDTQSHCYAVLGLIHSLWKPIPGRFKDYIGVPKANMYQSLHTTVMGPQGEKVEFQIRTEEMHRVAEQGFAAHWKYKEGSKSDQSLEQKFAWLRQALDWLQEMKSSREFMQTVKTDLFEESVYVFTPAGEVKELPSGSTTLDFAYSIHSDVGDHCTGAKVNGRMVPLKTSLNTGDTIEILTSHNQVPSKDWLKLVKSSRAKNRIRHFLNQEEQKRSLALGHEILDREARKHGLSLQKLLKSEDMRQAVKELGFTRTEKLVAAVGFGKLSGKQVLNRFVPETEVPEQPPVVKTRKLNRKTKQGIKIRGVGDVLVHFSRCCNPVPGDDVVGFITRGKGVSVHTMDCTNVRNGSLDPDRLVDLEWDATQESTRPVRISVVTTNKPGILANISAMISSENINISAADIRLRKDGRSMLSFILEVKSRRDLDHIVHAISNIREVLEVRRVQGL